MNEPDDGGRAAMRAFGVAAVALAGLLFSLTPAATSLDDALLDREWRLLRQFAPRAAPDDIIVVGRAVRRELSQQPPLAIEQRVVEPGRRGREREQEPGERDGRHAERAHCRATAVVGLVHGRILTRHAAGARLTPSPERSRKPMSGESPGAAQLKSISDPFVRELAALGRLRSYPKNTVFITEGDSSDSVFVILAGRVKVFLSDTEGHEMILDTQGPGEYVGEMALDGKPRSASVMTLEPSTFSVVARDPIKEAIRRNPDFALDMISKIIDRARLATNSVKDLALLDVYGRVARLLLNLAVEHDGRLQIPEKLTQQEIAERVGASRDMVSRIFRDLTAGGYIKVENRIITITKKPPARW